RGAVAWRVGAIIAQEFEVALERVTAAKGRECRRVVVRHRMMHAADERQAVHHLGRVRQVLADAKPRDAGRDRTELAADFGRGLWLHVERVDMARAAVVKNQDARADRWCRDSPAAILSGE